MNDLKEALRQLADRLEAEKSKAIRTGKWSPRFHVMPPVGWLNDPNGLCQYRGKYYFFFQYGPFTPNGGLKLWGEYTTEDMIHYEYQGVALYADSPYDCHGVFSGSAFTEDGKIELFYTGNIELDGEYDHVLSGRGSNTIYVISEDGVHFSHKECLLTSQDYPRDYTLHIRDPKVWKENGQYYMVLGGRKRGDKGAVLLYRSENKKEWQFLKELTTREPFGYMWECPDLFVLNGQRILSFSPQGLTHEKFRYQNICQSGYFTVSEQDELFDFKEWDMGFDFYAPQTFRDEKGRRILVGWAGIFDDAYSNPTTELGWQHLLTTPRELTLRDGKVLQNPVEEMLMLREKQLTMREGQDTEIEDECFDLIIEKIESEHFSLTIEKDCIFRYKGGVLELEFKGDIGSGRTIRRAKAGKVDCLRVLADTSLLEIYVNDGEYVFTTRYYSEGRRRNVRYDGSKGKCTLWQLSK